MPRTLAKREYYLTRDRKILGGSSKDYSFPCFVMKAKRHERLS